MRTLLRKTTNGQFFQGPDRWTTDPAEAFNFKSIDCALGFIRRWSLQDVELAFAFANQASVKRMPLTSMDLKYCED